MSEPKYPAVVAYIQNEAGLLLSVTRKDSGEDAAPGGKCGANESFHRALRRETREETNVELVHWRLVYDGLHTSGRRVLAYRAIEWRGVPEALEYGTRIAWVTPEALANGFGAEYHRRALRAAGLLNCRAYGAPIETFTRSAINTILGPRFVWRENQTLGRVEVVPPANMTNDDQQRLERLSSVIPIGVRLAIGAHPYR